LLNTDFDFTALREYLSMLAGFSVNIHVPQKGQKKRLIEMAEKNAAEYLENSTEKIIHKEDMTAGAAERLRDLLGIKSARRIECYDISNISGTDKVGSGVTFIDGEPSKGDYRRYRIKTVDGSDDYASLREVLTRRVKGDLPLPDLFVIDGGKGQLSAVAGVLSELGCEVPTISLAEKQELIFLVGRQEPLALSKSDYALRLLQRIRDEAHRFAITYHRTLRSRRSYSELTSIAGVGARTRDKLINSLTFKEIKSLPAEELSKRAGIDKTAARNIEEYYKGKGE
jgi:excinuclease ABC subunit C